MKSSYVFGVSCDIRPYREPMLRFAAQKQQGGAVNKKSELFSCRDINCNSIGASKHGHSKLLFLII